MNHQKTVLLLAALIFTITSCSKYDGTGDYLAFGSAAGMCAGNCARFFMIKNNNLYPDDMDFYNTTRLVFSDIPLAAEKYEIAKVLKDEFPEYLRRDPGRTFGCPDCYDQGGIHIEFRENGKTKTWHIDTNTEAQPEEIRSYIMKIIQVLGQLN